MLQIGSDIPLTCSHGGDGGACCKSIVIFHWCVIMKWWWCMLQIGGDIPLMCDKRKVLSRVFLKFRKDTVETCWFLSIVEMVYATSTITCLKWITTMYFNSTTDWTPLAFEIFLLHFYYLPNSNHLQKIHNKI